MYCTTCGAPVVDGASYCGACGTYLEQPPPQSEAAINAETPADTPTAVSTAPGSPAPSAIVSVLQPAYAGFWLRAGALILDSMILVGLGIGFIVVVAVFDAGLLVEDSPQADAVELAGGLVSWLYYALMESSASQATLGKRALGIRVTNVTGERISFARATGRYFGKVLSALTLGIGYLMAAFTDRKQTLHDMVASCVVVKVRQESP